MFCCLRTCLNGQISTQAVPLLEEQSITLDSKHMGHEVVLLKNATRICGSGGILTTAPLVQSKSYFEVKIQQGGAWSIGLATRQADLNKPRGGQDKESWCLCSDYRVYNDGRELHKLPERRTGIVAVGDTPEKLAMPGEGDVIGVAYDHVELNFFLNGRNLDVPVLSVRGAVFPVLYADEGAVLDVILDGFSHAPPAGFEKIMLEQSLL